MNTECYRYLHMWAWLIMDYVVKEVRNELNWNCKPVGIENQLELETSWNWKLTNNQQIQVHEDGSGHWECSLISNMFVCGKLKERNLTLCYVPGPIFRIFKFFFGEKT